MKRRNLLLGGTVLLSPWLLAACSRDETRPAEAALPPPPADPQAAYQLAAGGSGFTVGQMMAAHAVQVFFDPLCPHCATLWEASKPLFGRIKMVWMPVGLLSPASVGHGAAILAAPQPAEAMDRHAVLVREKRAQQGETSSDEAVRTRVQNNTELLRRLGADSVPALYFRNAATGAFGMHAGGMGTEELRRLLGLGA
ncbi:thioredoxin fold domain-containing protein [Caldimonas tepidiphila]|uniref:thioredoxin fold domain-containing protein n=1 Tax=Caldimonas tepidiphila TaxID=2315841 RepID=UPI000E5B9E27|nr:thioredoxin fold domain-containing protein [Caldimonas tepidiphila]